MRYKVRMMEKRMKPKEPYYITITGFQHYYEKKPFAIGNLIRCRKEPDNCHDAEAIKCTLPMVGTVGYVANSTYTVAGGTMSAGRLYDKVEDKFYARVLFTTASKIICRVEDGCGSDLAAELNRQQKDEDDWEVEF